MPNLPPFLSSLPSWVQWLWPVVMSVLVNAVLPALAKALPAEATLINDIALFLNGQTPSANLKAAYDHYHAQKGA